MCLTILEKIYRPYVDFTQKRYKIFQNIENELVNRYSSFPSIGCYYFSVGEELDCTVDIKGNKFSQGEIFSLDDKKYKPGFHSYLTLEGLYQIHKVILAGDIFHNHNLFPIYEVEASKILARGCERHDCSDRLYTVTVSQKIKLIRRILPEELKKFI